MTREIIDFLRATPAGYHRGWGDSEYSGWQDEQMSWKTGCYVGDWSFLWDIEVRGPDALRVFRDTGVNSVEAFAIGQAKHLIQCDSQGKVIAEGVLMRMAEDVFRTQSTTAFWTGFTLSKGGYQARWEELWTFQLQISGPHALALCEKLAGESLRDIRFMHFRPITIAGKSIYALRQGMAGEIGFELHGDEADKGTVLRAILDVGQEFGLRRLGRRTAMINHLEAAFPTGMWHYTIAMFSAETAGFGPFIGNNFREAGHTPPALAGSFEPRDVSELTFTPYDLGWGKSVRFDHEFTGRAALEKAAAAPRYQRVTLEFDKRDVIDLYASLFEENAEPYEHLDMPHPSRWIVWADTVKKDGCDIGVSSTPGYSYFFRRVLSLAFIEPSLAQPGTAVEVLWGSPGKRQKLIRATVAAAPYKRDTRRSNLATASAS